MTASAPFTPSLPPACDACITLAAPGAAPEGLNSTGNPEFAVPSSLLGVPSLSLPLFEVDGMPLGLQVIGYFDRDADAFRRGGVADAGAKLKTRWRPVIQDSGNNACATSTPSIIFFPSAITTRSWKRRPESKDLGKRVRGIPALSDIDIRLRIVEPFDNYSQVLSHGLPPMERLWGPDKSPEMAEIANDGLAEVAAKHPRHFVGWSALLPMNAPEAAAKEAERALKNGANAVQLATNANGVPLDEPRSCRSST